jgi:hypothetical protein
MESRSQTSARTCQRRLDWSTRQAAAPDHFLTSRQLAAYHSLACKEAWMSRCRNIDDTQHLSEVLWIPTQAASWRWRMQVPHGQAFDAATDATASASTRYARPLLASLTEGNDAETARDWHFPWSSVRLSSACLTRPGATPVEFVSRVSAGQD